MSDTRVSLLTPPAAGAVATVAVAGRRAWEVVRRLFRPAGSKPLPETPDLHRVWFGRLGDGVGDEVVVAVRQTDPEPCVEVHCHGGRRVVRWVIEQLVASGCSESVGRAVPDTTHTVGHSPTAQLPLAPTLRTASILLDQYHGAFDRAVCAILADPEAGREQLVALARFAPVGRHLVAPWKVVIAGPPNVGKSSLVNALAGYQRAVVSEIAGTTRDVVTVPVAFDGWPVELADTAGLREAEGLEAEGIDRARQFLAGADLVVWVFDATAPEPEFPHPDDVISVRMLPVVNKTDCPAAWDLGRIPDALRLSATTGDGVPELVAAVARMLVPDPPDPGAAVPYTPHLADLIEAAHASLVDGRPADAARILREAVGAG